MKILLVYPKYPDTFWSFKYALKFISKKASLPPLGLLTVAAMLPAEWEQRLVDMNVQHLTDADLCWADYVMLSAMTIQKESANSVITRCKELGVKVIAGGPLFTASPDEFIDVDHLILNEAEITLPLFLDDLRKGQAGHVYSSPQWADLSITPQPRFDLLNMKAYASMSVQYSRGCPFDCDFCNITVLYGRVPRTKSRSRSWPSSRLSMLGGGETACSSSTTTSSGTRESSRKIFCRRLLNGWKNGSTRLP